MNFVKEMVAVIRKVETGRNITTDTGLRICPLNDILSKENADESVFVLNMQRMEE